MQQRQAAVPLPSIGSAEHATRRRAGLNNTARRYLTFLLLVAPVVVLRLVTTAYPIGNTVYLSATNSSLLSGTSQFIGLDNYRAMLSDFGIATPSVSPSPSCWDRHSCSSSSGCWWRCC